MLLGFETSKMCFIMLHVVSAQLHDMAYIVQLANSLPARAQWLSDRLLVPLQRSQSTTSVLAVTLVTTMFPQARHSTHRTLARRLRRRPRVAAPGELAQHFFVVDLKHCMQCSDKPVRAPRSDTVSCDTVSYVLLTCCLHADA